MAAINEDLNKPMVPARPCRRIGARVQREVKLTGRWQRCRSKDNSA